MRGSLIYRLIDSLFGLAITIVDRRAAKKAAKKKAQAELLTRARSQDKTRVIIRE